MGRGRAMGELIPDKLFGQEDSKMSSLPPLAAAVAAAAAALSSLSGSGWCAGGPGDRACRELS